jgi:hypothetical protein
MLLKQDKKNGSPAKIFNLKSGKHFQELIFINYRDF